MGLFNRFSKKNKPEETETPQDNKLNPDDWFWGSFLMNEAKFRHQQNTVKRSSKDDPITLGYIIKELLNISPTDIGSMTVVSRGEFGRTEKTEIIESQSDVLAFKPYEAILYVSKDGDTVPRTGMNTVLVISYRPGDIVFDNREEKNDKSKLCTDNSIIMFLRGIGPFMYETAYMRVSVMIPNFTSPDDFRTSHSKNAPFTTSFVLGFDIVPPEKKLKRYDEIEQSLIEKSNRDEELSSEEKTVLEGITYSKDLGYDFGYGRWLVSENRFADALMPLMKAYDHLKTAVVTDYDRLHEVFAETCFNLGFCFNEMEQFDRAAYYLDLIQSYDRPKYIIEYINSLVNNGDPRAMRIVQHYLSEFNEGKKQIDSEEMSFFYDFLARRLAYLFIDYKMWDNARNLLEQLKESPACHDFAVGELEYIKQVTGNQSKMKSLYCLIALFVGLLSLSSCNGSNEDLKSKLLPQISEAYKNGKWGQAILLTDSLRNNGISYTDYIGDKGFDVAYCEALIATGQADKAVAEIKHHISTVNPQDFYAYHTLGVAYSELNDTANAIDSYNNSVRINPGYARPYIHLAHIYAKKDVEKCMDNYSKAIQLFGNHEMYDEILKFGFESWEVDSTNTIILKYMGDACFAKEDLQNAKTLYGRVLADAGNKGSAVPQALFESDYQLALINYIEGNYKETYSLLEIIYANEKGFPKNSNSILFGAYILGAAATHQMDESIVSQKLMNLANDIDSEAAKGHYEYFLSIRNK